MLMDSISSGRNPHDEIDVSSIRVHDKLLVLDQNF